MNKSMQKIVDTIQRYMEKDTTMIWHQPYFSASQANAVSRNNYQGINHFVTAIASAVEGYTSPYWATFKQIEALGGTLVDAKGKGVPIIFYKDLPSNVDQDDTNRGRRFAVRHSFVFNLDRVQGVDVETVQPDPTDIARDATAESLIAAYMAREGVRLSSAATPAYVPTTDTVNMPPLERFESQDEFYSTFFHEIAHSSGHNRRLARFDHDQVCFESKEDYSKEELIAELTSSILSHECSVDSQASIKNSAAYIQGWSRFIKDDTRAFVSAVSHAYKARDFIVPYEPAA